MASMNKIQDKLYLGNIKSASDLNLLKANVSCIILFLSECLICRI